jgi:hypothetical protein
MIGCLFGDITRGTSTPIMASMLSAFVLIIISESRCTDDIDREAISKGTKHFWLS